MGVFGKIPKEEDFYPFDRICKQGRKYFSDSKTNIGKLLLRKILKENNVDSFVSKETLGFNVNTINLWKSHGKDLCNQYLLNSRIIEDGWINKQWITKHINNSELNVKYVNKFLGLLAFEIWYRLFVTKEMKPNTTLN